MLSPTFTPCDLATSGLITTLTGLPPLSGSVKAKVHCDPPSGCPGLLPVSGWASPAAALPCSSR